MLSAAILANAEGSDQSLDLLVLILESIGVVAGMAIAAAVPLFVVNGRRAMRPSFLVPLCLLWAVIAAGGWLYLLFARYHWDSEYGKLVMTGLYDPSNRSTRPAVNLPVLLVLAVGYAGLIGAALLARPLPPRELSGEVPMEPPAPQPTNGHPHE